jgi:hypothetical protein
MAGLNFDAGVDDYLRQPEPEQPVAPRLKDAVAQTADAKPDFEAELQRVAKVTGVPVDTARADPKGTAQQAAGLSLDLDGLVETHPKTAAFMANPANAAVAKDDWESLKGTEFSLKALGDLTKASFWASLSGGVGALQGLTPLLKQVGVDGADALSDPTAPMGAFLQGLRRYGKKRADELTPKTDNPWASGVNSGVVSFMENAPLALASIAAKNPGIVLGGMAANTGGQAYGDAKDAKKGEGTAIAYGVTQGLIEAGTEMIPMHYLVGDALKGTGILQTLGHQLISEIPGEQIATASQDFVEWATLHPDQPVSTYINSRGDAAISTLVASLVGVASNSTVSKIGDVTVRNVLKAQKATEATHGGELLDQLTKIAAASKLRERSPDTFEAFVADATKEGPIENVYIDARQLTDMLAQSANGEDAQAKMLAMQRMPSLVGQLDQALQTGGDVAIPVSEFAAYATGSDLAQSMLDHLKTAPDAMSRAEAQEFMQSQAEELKATVERVVAEGQVKDDFAASADKVREGISAQLAQANRFTPDVNEAYAGLTASFYATQAARLGITPEELYAKHPVQIAAQGVEPGSFNETLGQPNWEDALKRGREIQGLRAAIRDPETGDIFTGYSHQSIINTLPLPEQPDYVEGRYGRMQQAWDESTADVGFVTKDGEFISRDQANERLGFGYTMEDARDFLRNRKLYQDAAPPTASWPKVGEKPSSDIRQWDAALPLAGDTVDGLKVRSKIDNTGSIPASFSDYTELPGVREVPFSWFSGPDKETPRVRELKDAIAESGEITPLIVAVDSHNGPYILEGAHRYDALQHGGKTTFPALVVFDNDDEHFSELAQDEAPADPENPAFKAWFGDSKVVDAEGKPLVVFHGAKRGDRIAEAGGFMAERATSGPMAFFTESPELASSYTGKEDTSEEVIDYEVYFTVNGKSLKEAWDALPVATRVLIRTRGWEVGEDEETGEIGFNHGIVAEQTWDHYLRDRSEGAGNGLRALYKLWIEGGVLFDREEEFKKVLKAFGIEGAAYNDPYAQHPTVFPVYLSIQNPLDVQDIPDHVVAAIREASKTAPPPQYEGGMDQWDKRAMRPEFWMQLFEDGLNDPKAGYGFTSIPDWVTNTLRGLGYDGLTDIGGKGAYGNVAHKVWVPFNEGQAKSIFNTGGFDPNSRDLLAQANDGQRGSYNPATNLITLLRGADLSTFLHESGHFYLETLARLAAEPGAPQEIVDDMATAMKFMGHNGVDPAAWLAMPVDKRRDGHETWARGFEAYLLEGKSPSNDLRGLFQRFRSWLLTIYQSAAKLNVQLTDDVRGVFDRLLATQQQIENNELARGYAPLFENAAAAGMTQAEWESYQRLGAEATQDAVDALEARSMRDMRLTSNTRDRTIRRLQRDAAKKRAAIRTEVKAELLAEPVNRARQLLRFGLLDGQEIEGPHKLAISEVEKLYGDQPAELQDWRKLGYGRYGMLAEEGATPDQIAELVGLSSGVELVESLLNAEPLNTQVDGLTDRRMLERYGDLTDKDAIEVAADKAIHNDARLRFVAAEHAALTKATGGRKMLAEAARSFAAGMVARQRVRDIKPSRFNTAETKAAKAADKFAKAGDLVSAATEKRNELINGYAAKAAYDAQDEVAKALRLFARFDSTGVRKALDPDYRDQIDALLERFDLRKGQSLTAIDKRKSLAEWAKRQKEITGLEPAIPEDILNEANRRHYRDLTLEELRGLVDSVRNIAHLGRLKHKLLTAKDRRTFEEAVEALADTAAKNALGPPRNALESNQLGDKVERAARGFLTVSRKFDSLARRLDGHDDNGTFWNLLVRPKNDAGAREETMRHANTLALHELLKPVLADKFRQKVFIPEIGNSLSLEGRMAVALNWGNETNRKRVMDGDGWSEAQVMAILKTLEPRHFAFVQAIWDHTESFRPQIETMMRRQDGITAEFVDPSPFEAVAADGSTVQMRGGYYHIEYDPDRSAKAEEFDAIKLAKQAVFGASRTYTRPGHRKARVDEVLGRPIKKTLSVGFQHLDDVIHDLAWSDYIIDAKRLLGNETVGNAIRAHAGPEVLRSMRRSVEAMEVGDTPAQNGFEASVNYVRSGATIAGLGYNLMTSIMQPLGVLNGTKRIGAKWMGVGLARVVGDAATMQNSVAWVHSLSPMMLERARGATLNREMYDVRRRVTAGTRSDILKNAVGGEAAVKVDQGLSVVEASFFYLIGKAQMIADVPTWIGQYEKAMADHGDEPKAVAQADQAVIDSQGGGRIGDLSEIQRGGPLLKVWTNFYSYFNVIYNQLAESVEETQLRGAKHLPILAADVALVLILPTVLGTVFKAAIRGDDWDKVPGTLAHDLISGFFGMFVGLRDIAGATLDGNQSPAGISILKTTANFTAQMKQGEVDEAFLKALNAEAGILFHYPAGQVQRTAMGMKALSEGSTHNPLVVVTGPPPKKK